MLSAAEGGGWKKGKQHSRMDVPVVVLVVVEEVEEAEALIFALSFEKNLFSWRNLSLNYLHGHSILMRLHSLAGKLQVPD